MMRLFLNKTNKASNRMLFRNFSNKNKPTGILFGNKGKNKSSSQNENKKKSVKVNLNPIQNKGEVD